MRKPTKPDATTAAEDLTAALKQARRHQKYVRTTLRNAALTAPLLGRGLAARYRAIADNLPVIPDDVANITREDLDLIVARMRAIEQELGLLLVDLERKP